VKPGPVREQLPPRRARELETPFWGLIAHQGDWLMRLRPAGRALTTNSIEETR
jgi:hypothetical protein